MSQNEYAVIEAAEVAHWAAHTEEADVVIVGLGCAGVCAAIEAREAGADVLVFERASGGGGVTGMAAGHLYLGGGTRVQKAVGVDDTVEDMFTYLMMNTPEPDEEKIRRYCDESVSHFDWLVEMGVPFNDTMYKGKHVLQMTDECLIWSGNEEVHPFREKAKPAPRGHKVAQVGELGGAKMMECLTAKAESLGIRIVYDAHVHNLVREEGKIVGVSYRVYGEEKGSVRARKAVILAAGQFTQNEDLLEEYLPELLDEAYMRQFTPNDDGAGHQLGRAAGGVLKHMDGALVTAAFYPPESHIKGILVNQEGKRYVSEDSYHSRSSMFTTKQSDRRGWLILDEKTYAVEPQHYGAYPLVDAFETVEEIEKALEMPTGSLQKTVSSYNEHAAKGEDPEFHKGKKWLTPLDQAPFAALDASVGQATYMAFTLGGLDVTIEGEVIAKGGGTISGLYAIGGCASNIAQDGTGYSSGTCIGESTFFGRRAGRHSASS
ncbi:MAG: FAD-binding protein [bacterium]|nr:FAD-dependent oxidoreductase [Deltaproteobacteria bacterium]MCP4905856.1 FAD-binding protein [bacterium]